MYLADLLGVGSKEIVAVDESAAGCLYNRRYPEALAGLFDLNRRVDQQRRVRGDFATLEQLSDLYHLSDGELRCAQRYHIEFLSSAAPCAKEGVKVGAGDDFRLRRWSTEGGPAVGRLRCHSDDVEHGMRAIARQAEPQMVDLQD
jgi:hypothetical protein